MGPPPSGNAVQSKKTIGKRLAPVGILLLIVAAIAILRYAFILALFFPVLILGLTAISAVFFYYLLPYPNRAKQEEEQYSQGEIIARFRSLSDINPAMATSVEGLIRDEEKEARGS